MGWYENQKARNEAKKQRRADGITRRDEYNERLAANVQHREDRLAEKKAERAADPKKAARDAKRDSKRLDLRIRSLSNRHPGEAARLAYEAGYELFEVTYRGASSWAGLSNRASGQNTLKINAIVAEGWKLVNTSKASQQQFSTGRKAQNHSSVEYVTYTFERK